jgi:hypothetical protein
MNGIGQLLATTLLAAMLSASVAQAMEIRQFDKMADQNQSEYIGDLVVGAENAKPMKASLILPARSNISLRPKMPMMLML